MNYNTRVTPTYWQKQTPELPLFPDLIWSKPENRQSAGKLLIISGNLHSFAAPAEAYEVAQTAGVGATRVLLPDALKKSLGHILDFGEYLPSSPSGSFSQQALAGMLEQASWADGVLLAGDFGRNSETAMTIEKFLAKRSDHLITATKDAADYIVSTPSVLINPHNALLVLSLSQLQHLFKSLKHPNTVTIGMAIANAVEIMHEFTKQYHFNLITKHRDTILVASQGNISTTKIIQSADHRWCEKTATKATVWAIQHPTKLFEALTTSLCNPI